jgi:Tfp pilus assembly protein FimT
MYKLNEGKLMIELLLAITVIAMLSALILPSLSQFRNEQSLKNAVADVVSLLNKAKSDANSLTVSTDYSVHFESGRAVYFYRLIIC